ncbi:MAG: DnaJ domain-containing protein [Parachlamydiaceae bacterium]|nr:DnaJ domain-containing protein [Parachlamydiaceae bacterium]
MESSSFNFANRTFYSSSINDVNLINEEAKMEVKFTNGHSDYAIFEQRYEGRHNAVNDEGISETCLGRKIWAIPNMLIGVVKTIYHLALSALMYVVGAPSEYVDQYLFCAIRDVEEIYGNFVLIFHDKLGLYHIEQAQFQKQCYFEYVPPQVPRQNGATENYGPLNSEFAKKYSFGCSSNSGKYANDILSSALQEITLLDYKTLPEEERQTVIKRISNEGIFSRCPLDTILEGLPSKGLDLAHLLETSSDATLEMFTLEDLVYFDLSPLKFFLMTDEQIMKLNLNEVGTFKKGRLTKAEDLKIQYLRERLTTIELTDAHLEEILPDASTLDELTRLTAEEIYKQQQDLNPIALAFFSNEQIALLKLTLLTKEQNLALFAFLNAEEIEIRLGFFKDDDVINAIHENKLPEKALGYLPENYLLKMDFSLLDKTVIAGIFFDRSRSCDISLSEEILENDKRQFANFDAKDIVKALKLDKLNSYHISLLSEAHWAKVRLSELESDVLKSIFSIKYGETEGVLLDRERFANFDAKSVVDAIKLNKLNWYHLNLLSKEQLIEVKPSEIDSEVLNLMFSIKHGANIGIPLDRERFANFDAKDVAKAIKLNKLNWYHLNLLSKEQLSEVEPSELDPEVLNSMFSIKHGENIGIPLDKARFANFDAKDVAKAIKLNKLNWYHLNLLSKEQLSEVKLSELDPDVINPMFSIKHGENIGIPLDKARFANFDAADVVKAIQLYKLNWYHLNLLSKEQLIEVKPSELDPEVLNLMFSIKHGDNTGIPLDRERFANFDAKDVAEAIKLNKLNWYHLSLLSNEQSIGAKSSKFDPERVKVMFPQKTNENEIAVDKECFANFDGKDVAEAIKLNKLTQYNLNLLSVTQLQAINFSEVSQALINTLFPDYSVDRFRRENSSFSSTFKSINGKVLKNTSGWNCRYSDAQLQRMSEEQKQKNEDVFNKLLPEQQKDLAPRLYKASKENHENDSNSNVRPGPHIFFEPFSNPFSDPFFSSFFSTQGFAFDPSFFDENQTSTIHEDDKKNFAILEVSEDATIEEIKAKYKKLAMLYHPDKQSIQEKESQEEFEIRKSAAEEKFKAITTACAELINSKSRGAMK